MKRLRLGSGLALAIAGALLACGSSRLPTPAYSPQPTEALEPADFPPRPSRIEFVPDQPDDVDAVWIDGEWTWQGTRYRWKAGRWVVPPPGATFSPWAATRGASGVLYIAAGTWRDKAGNEVAEPEALASGRARADRDRDGGGRGPGARRRPIVPDAGPPTDAGLADVAFSDAMARPDAVPLPSP